MEKTRFLQENQRYQGNTSWKDGHNKGRNAMDLIEVEDIKKSWQDYTEELCKKKIFMTQITTMVWSLN